MYSGREFEMRAADGTKDLLWLKLKISMFCVLSQNYQHFFFNIMYASYSKLFKELKNGIEIVVGQAAFKLWIKTVEILF